MIRLSPRTHRICGFSAKKNKTTTKNRLKIIHIFFFIYAYTSHTKNKFFLTIFRVYTLKKKKKQFQNPHQFVSVVPLLLFSSLFLYLSFVFTWLKRVFDLQLRCTKLSTCFCQLPLDFHFLCLHKNKITWRMNNSTKVRVWQALIKSKRGLFLRFFNKINPN